MIKISPTARLPFEQCKGSPRERLVLAKKLNNEFFNEICKKFTAKDITIDVFESTLKKVTPAKIEVAVKDYGKKGGYTVNTINTETNEVVGFNIYLPANHVDKKLALLDSDTFLHETFHYFSHLTNPKHISRSVKMYELGLIDRTNQFYKDCFYTKKPFIPQVVKQNLDDFLTQFTPQEQIEFLQNTRYRLTEEYNAYGEGFKYLDKIQDEHLNLISEKINGKEKEDFNFPEKIKIVTDKLKEVIAEYRKS